MIFVIESCCHTIKHVLRSIHTDRKRKFRLMFLFFDHLGLRLIILVFASTFIWCKQILKISLNDVQFISSTSVRLDERLFFYRNVPWFQWENTMYIVHRLQGTFWVWSHYFLVIVYKTINRIIPDLTHHSSFCVSPCRNFSNFFLKIISVNSIQILVWAFMRFFLYFQLFKKNCDIWRELIGI